MSCLVAKRSSGSLTAGVHPGHSPRAHPRGASERSTAVIRPKPLFFSTTVIVSGLSVPYNSGGVNVMAKQHDLGRLREILRQQLPLLEERYGVASLGLFGSYVRREASPTSDLDVLVRFNRTPGLIRFIELENYLSDLLGIRVDLVMAEALKPNVAQRVFAEVEPV